MTQSIDRAKSIQEVLELAIAREMKACQNYRHLCDLVQEKGLKNKLNFLSHEEESHRVHLIGLYEKLTGSLAPAPETPTPPPSGQAPSSLTDILTAAMKKEEEAHLFYKEASGNTDDNALKIILDHLASEEEVHRQMLSLELEALAQKDLGTPLETVPWHLKELW